MTTTDPGRTGEFRFRAAAVRQALPTLLSFNGGYVDAAGFLALHGLFSTHVTGNFVTIGAALALGTSGVLAKVLALPLFCLVVLLARLTGVAIERGGRSALRPLLGVVFVLLALAAGLAVAFGPFPDGDAPKALGVAATLVSAMAIQNALHRTHLTAGPPSTVMTLTTTQLMIDVADLIRRAPPEARALARARLGPMARGVATFAFGCGAAALFYAAAREWCFVLPPLVALAALFTPGAKASPPA